MFFCFIHNFPFLIHNLLVIIYLKKCKKIFLVLWHFLVGSGRFVRIRFRPKRFMTDRIRIRNTWSNDSSTKPSHCKSPPPPSPLHLVLFLQNMYPCGLFLLLYYIYILMFLLVRSFNTFLTSHAILSPSDGKNLVSRTVVTFPFRGGGGHTIVRKSHSSSRKVGS